jgi:diguanylate cyclase (GGDEF)-like protein/PAS domain S-box-containing protein
MKKRIKLINTIKVLFITSFMLLTVVIVVLQISRSHHQFNQRAATMRNDYVTEQKALIQHEVERVVAAIDYQRAQTEKQTQEIARQRAYQAYAIAQNLYQQYHLTKPALEIQQLIIDALRPIYVKQQHGGHFVTRLDGTAILFTEQPELEGSNLLKVQENHGKYIFKEMIAITEQAGEGRYDYLWTTPDGEKRDHKRISFVKRFEPYNWLIGTSLCVTVIERQIQAKLLAEISNIRFGKEGYIFINSLNGDVLVSNGNLFSPNRKLWHIFDKDPQKTKELFAKEYAAAMRPEGGFIYYSFQKLTNTDQESPKSSFIYGILDWNWLVGAGVYLDDVENQIVQLQTELNHQLNKDIQITLTTTVLLLILFLLLIHLISRRLLGDFSLFVTSIEQASSDDKAIDLSLIRFKELYRMAGDVNIMLQDKVVARQHLFTEKENLQTTLDSIGDAVIATDTQGNITRMNPVAERLTGWSVMQGKDRPLTDVFHIVNATTHSEADNPIQQVLKSGKTVELANHTMLIAKGGDEYQIADSAAPIHDASGIITGVVLVFRDVTEEYQVREQLRHSEKRYRTFFENSTDPMVIYKDGVFIDCNNAAVDLLKYASRDDLLHKTPAQISPKLQPSGAESSTLGREMIEIAYTQGSHHFEWNHLSKNGDIIPVEISATAVPTDEGTVVHGIMRDISARQQATEQLDYLAHHHPLTGLPNRLLLSARLEHSIQYAKREDLHGAVLFLDLDNFKKINDSLGHSAGDEILKTVAERLQEHIRDVDTVAHLSGDEFVIILQSIHTVQDARSRAQQIINGMQHPFTVDGYELFTSCSIGIVEFDGTCNSMEDLLKNADAAMYEAKENGKNGYQLYSAQLTESAMEKVLLEAQLRRALERNELVVHYQPQVTLPEGKIVAVEALMRWQHPEIGLVPPDKFIPLSEETGLIIPMGEWILKTACEQLVTWRRQGFDIHRVAVNLSGKQIQLDTLPQTVQKVLQQTGCPAHALELEITEGFIMRHPEQSIAILQQIQGLGVELSVDDFGTGHSSLNYLKRLPINRLKIDRSFVWDIGENDNGEILTRTIIAMGHSLNLQITAEGIETDEQREFLEELNCNEAQGYLFSKPLPAEEVTELLQRKG